MEIEPTEQAKSSSDTLRDEATRIKAMIADVEDPNRALGTIAWALNLAAAWLDSLTDPDRQTRFTKVESEVMPPSGVEKKDWQSREVVDLSE